MGAGARLGSFPEIPGVVVDVGMGPTEEVAEESAAESGFVGFFKYAREQIRHHVVIRL